MSTARTPSVLIDLEKTRRPRSLTIVAWLFIVLGANAIFGIVWDLIHGRINIDLLALALFCGLGLLRGSSSWKTFAKVVASLCIVVLGLMLIVSAVLGETARLTYNGSRVDLGIPRALEMLLINVLLVGLLVMWLWVIRVLNSKETEKYFESKQPKSWRCSCGYDLRGLPLRVDEHGAGSSVCPECGTLRSMPANQHTLGHANNTA